MGTNETCGTCGAKKSFTNPFTLVDCPTCGAEHGFPCYTKNGNVTHHKSRDKAYRAAHPDRCPECGLKSGGEFPREDLRPHR